MRVRLQRSLASGDSERPGWQPKEKAALTAKAGYDCFNNATSLRRPEAVEWAPSVCRPAGYLPSGSCHWALVEQAEGRRPWNRPSKERELTRNSWAGNPKRMRPNCQRKEELSNQHGYCTKGRGPTDPSGRRRRDPRTLASPRHWLLQLVAATAGLTLTPSLQGSPPLWSGRAHGPVRG